MSSTVYNWFSRLLIVMGIALFLGTKSIIGGPGAVILSLCAVCGIWLFTFPGVKHNPDSLLASGMELIGKMTMTIALCLGLCWVAMFVVSEAIVPAFFGTLSTIDGSNGASNPLNR